MSFPSSPRLQSCLLQSHDKYSKHSKQGNIKGRRRRVNEGENFGSCQLMDELETVSVPLDSMITAFSLLLSLFLCHPFLCHLFFSLYLCFLLLSERDSLSSFPLKLVVVFKGLNCECWSFLKFCCPSLYVHLLKVPSCYTLRKYNTSK